MWYLWIMIYCTLYYDFQHGNIFTKFHRIKIYMVFWLLINIIKKYAVCKADSRKNFFKNEMWYLWIMIYCTLYYDFQHGNIFINFICCLQSGQPEKFFKKWNVISMNHDLLYPILWFSAWQYFYKISYN
jgi:hypothetical protein